MAKKTTVTPVRCLTCAHANIFQYACNPVIAQCEYDGTRNVASTLITCHRYTPATHIRCIENRKPVRTL